MNFGERLTYIRKNHPSHLNQADFAASIGMTRSAYSMYEINKVQPTASKIKLICITYNVNPDWLENGEGEPFISDPNSGLRNHIASIMKGESDFAISVMTALAEMPPEWWNAWEQKLNEVRASMQSVDSDK